MARLRSLLAIGCVAAAGCLSSPGAAGNAPIVGTWDYVGLQTSPTTATLTGTLKIDAQSNGNVSGTLSVIETPSGGGSPVSLGGPVTGQSVTNIDVQFYATLDNAPDAQPYIHLGTITGDSLEGRWAEGTSGGPAGSFRAHRVSIP